MAGSCLRSQPKAVGGLTLNNDKVLAEMISELGAASLLVYFQVTEWDSAQTAKSADTGRRERSARGAADSTLGPEWEGELVERLRHAAGHMHGGHMDIDDALDELSEHLRRGGGAAVLDDDVLFSRRLRAIVHLLRKCVGPGSVAGLVAVAVTSGLLCYFVWHFLCFWQLVWQDRLNNHTHPPRRCCKDWS